MYRSRKNQSGEIPSYFCRPSFFRNVLRSILIPMSRGKFLRTWTVRKSYKGRCIQFGRIMLKNPTYRRMRPAFFEKGLRQNVKFVFFLMFLSILFTSINTILFYVYNLPKHSPLIRKVKPVRFCNSTL